MQDKKNPDGLQADVPAVDPMEGIKPRLNRLPWERDVQDDQEAEAAASEEPMVDAVVADTVDHHASIPAESHTAAETTGNTAVSVSAAPEGSASGEASADEGAHHQPYRVGTRTYATPDTAIDSAANEKLFSMGVDEYEIERSRIRIFFDVLFGKIWKLMGLNLLTGLFNLPALLFMGFFAITYMQFIYPAVFQSSGGNDALASLMILFLPVGLLFLSIPFVAFGPAQAGMHYILRNYAYENPVFMGSDFKDKMKENFKQGLAVSVVNLVVFVIAFLDLYMYPRMAASMGWLMSVAGILLIVAFFVFLMMSMYVYPMMVRYHLTLKNLYRNAFLFAIGKFLPNLLILVLVIAVSFGPFLIAGLFGNIIGYLIAYVFHLLLGLTLPGLIMSFLINPMLDKVMAPAAESTDEKDEDAE